MKPLRTLLLSILAALTAACATAPPSQHNDACAILKENRDWYSALRRTAKRWGAPMGLQMAIIRQESGFQHDAKPPRGDRRMLGLLPGKRPSSAYGYAQALDETWDEYRRTSGNGGADRDDFDDAVDFVGWYVNNTGRRAGVGQYAYRDHYLA